MKYSILINQKAVVECGLHKHTDLDDWAILDYILAWQTRPNAVRIKNYVWINYKSLLDEMPLLRIKTKQSVSNRIKKLKELNLIKITHDDEHRIFIKTTQLFHDMTQLSEVQNHTNLPSNLRNTPSNGRNTPVPPDGHTENHKRSKDKIYCRRKKFSDDDMKLVRFIFNKILIINPDHKPPNFDKWADMIRLMREQDNKSHKEICELFVWANKDPFWQSNILSPKKLRDKFDQLIIQRERKTRNEKNWPANQSGGYHELEQANAENMRYIEQLDREIEQIDRDNMRSKANKKD